MHFCHGECGPLRLYVHTPWGSLIIGTPSQVYWKGRYTDTFSPITWHPKR